MKNGKIQYNNTFEEIKEEDIIKELLSV